MDYARDLMTRFPQHLLTIHSKAHALKVGTRPTIPEQEILIRYEDDRNVLYVSSQLAERYMLGTFFTKLRRSKQYKGYQTKRMLTGTGLQGSASSVLVFNLDEPTVDRAELKKAGRPANTTLPRAYQKELSIKNMRYVAEVLRDYKAKMEKPIPLNAKEAHDLYKLMYIQLRNIRDMYSVFMNLAEDEKPIKFKRKSKRIPQSAKPERIYIAAIDRMVANTGSGFAHLIVRNLARYRINPETKLPEYQEKQIVPDRERYSDPDHWVGRYDDTCDRSGERRKKLLYIKIKELRHSIIMPDGTRKYDTAEMFDREGEPSLLLFDRDVRFKCRQNMSIGGKTYYCAVFDMARGHDPVLAQEKYEPAVVGDPHTV